MKHLARQFRRFLLYKRTLALGLLCIPISSAADLWLTILVGDALDDLRTASNADFLKGLFFLMLGVAFVRGVFRFYQRWWIVGVSRYVENDLKQALFDKLLALPLSFHHKNRSGDLVSRITSDVENIRMFLGPGLMYTLGAMCMLPLAIGTMVTLNAPLASAVVVPLLVMGCGMWLLSPRLQKHSLAVQESISDISQRAQETFAGIRIVKGYAREEQQTAKFDAASRETYRHQVELAKARGFSSAITWGSKDFTYLPILLIGGWSMIDRGFEAGDLFKFVDLTFKVFWPIIAVGWLAGVFPRAKVSAQRVQELLDAPLEIDDPAAPRELANVRGHFRLTDVAFTYPGAARPTLERITFEVRPGEVVGIVGATGSGKSTLLNLFARLYDADGRLELDGVPVKELRLATLRGAVGYVPQDSFLFSATWRENVGFGSERPLDDAELARLAELACMTDEVARFPNGYDQTIGERGVTLSGGQRQRTCIARALAKDPTVLILDDSLSAVDTETETALVRHLKSAGRGRTVILSAHRLSTVRHADRIVVLDGGRIQAIGTHDELVARDGWYSSTWARQQAQEELAEL
ncbi:MAG: ABC transporter ATP-binding protein/permease [Planctomycetes bacterium]|nr:ABC transporter ATP-binding protein/permease [Planctomycetota bacterium]